MSYNDLLDGIKFVFIAIKDCAILLYSPPFAYFTIPMTILALLPTAIHYIKLSVKNIFNK